MTETVRVAIAAGITAGLIALLVVSARDETDFGIAVAAAGIFGVLVAGLVLLWGWALA